MTSVLYEYKINLKVSHIFSKNIQPGKLHCTISQLKS